MKCFSNYCKENGIEFEKIWNKNSEESYNKESVKKDIQEIEYDAFNDF